MLRGGLGNDLMYGGNSKTDLGGMPMTPTEGDDFSGSLYMYGDEGHDEIWGSNNYHKEFIFGGEGEDIIYPG